MKKIKPLFDFDNPDDIDNTEPEYQDEEMYFVNSVPGKRIHIENNAKIEIFEFRKKQSLQEIINFIPEPGKSYHFLSDGSFHFYTVIPVLAELMGKIDELYISTWKIGRIHAIGLLELLDRGIVDKMNVMTGYYFKSIAPDIYSIILNGLIERKQRFIASPNHTKIMLINIGDNYIVIEGSANITANPRNEQFAMQSSKGLYDFHKAWMNEVYENAT